MAYTEQFKRARRSLRKLQILSELTASENISIPSPQQDEYVDALYHCFQDCWHLKDWIKHDDSAPTALKDAARRMEKAKVNEKNWVESLMLCADVANGSKHFKLTPRPPRLNAETQVAIMVKVRESIHDNAQGEATVAFRYSIVEPSGKDHDVLSVAQQALAEWEKLITENQGMIPS
jgi:hypothetical protein